MTIDHKTQTLEGFAVEEQIFLWDALGRAIDHALNSAWSIECEGLAYRITTAARLVGPSDLGVVPWRLTTGGVYAAVLKAEGIAVPETSEDEWSEWERVMAEYGNRQTNGARYKATVAAIEREHALGEWEEHHENR